MGVPSGDEEAGGSRGQSATLSLGRILVSGPVQLPLFLPKTQMKPVQITEILLTRV